MHTAYILTMETFISHLFFYKFLKNDGNTMKIAATVLIKQDEVEFDVFIAFLFLRISWKKKTLIMTKSIEEGPSRSFFFLTFLF